MTQEGTIILIIGRCIIIYRVLKSVMKYIILLANMRLRNKQTQNNPSKMNRVPDAILFRISVSIPFHSSCGSSGCHSSQ